MAVSAGSFGEHLVLAAFILLLTYLLETGWVAGKRSTMTIVFEKPELIHPSKRQELISELESRTGFRIHHIEVGDIDYLKDSVILTVHHERP